MEKTSNVKQLDFRKAVVDVDLPSGARVEKDAVTMLLLGSANHDPRRYDAPERFNIHREAQSHLACARRIIVLRLYPCFPIPANFTSGCYPVSVHLYVVLNVHTLCLSQL